MEVVILCGGRGERMRELTAQVPKPAVAVGGRPVVWHIMMMYASAGFKDFILCLGYKGEVIRQIFYDLGATDVRNDLGTTFLRYRDWSVRLADTGEHTMTGGRLLRIAPMLRGGTFLATYGDCVSDVNLRALVDFHFKSQRLATVTVVKPPPRFGVVRLEGDQVVSFAEKRPEDEVWISGGFFVFNHGVLDCIAGDDTVLELGPLADLARVGELSGFVHEGYWQCMDTLNDVVALNEQWDAGIRPWVLWESMES